MRLFRATLAVVLLAGFAAGTARGQSLGRFRMPSTIAQFVGVGYGPGHHAPIVRPQCYQPIQVPRFVEVPGGHWPYTADCAYSRSSAVPRGGLAPRSREPGFALARP